MIRISVLVAAAIIVIAAFVAGSNYPGHWAVYALFTVLSNALLLNGFRRGAIFFDTFIGIFLWLGFWLKFTYGAVLNQFIFGLPLTFDGSGSAFDHALIVSTCGLAGFLLASWIRGCFFSYPEVPPSCRDSGLFLLYSRHRLLCVGLFLAVAVFVAVTNAWLGIYQRGMVAQTVLPFGLNGIYKWLLQFGLASISALIIRFEIELKRNVTLMAAAPALLELFLSNVSLLSRGMILNSAGLAFGTWRLLFSTKIPVGYIRMAMLAIAFGALFAGSVLTVNYLRISSYEVELADSPEAAASVAPQAAEVKGMTTPLFIERWIGIESVIAVSSSKQLGWDLWREAWRERYDDGKLTLYDRMFIKSPYTYTSDMEKRVFHFVSLPGIIAFFYYPGSLIFLFVVLCACGLLAASLEFLTYRYAGKNWPLCSLIAQVIAYRYASFGYVPEQSYLLFGALILNIAILFAADCFLIRRYKISVDLAK
jgi:hypothetical protein